MSWCSPSCTLSAMLTEEPWSSLGLCGTIHVQPLEGQNYPNTGLSCPFCPGTERPSCIGSVIVQKECVHGGGAALFFKHWKRSQVLWRTHLHLVGSNSYSPNLYLSNLGSLISFGHCYEELPMETLA